MKRLRCGGMIVLMFVFLLVACSGPAEESGQNGEANAPEVQGTSAPGPLVPEVTAEGGSGGAGGAGAGGADEQTSERFGLPDAQACQDLAERLENGMGVADTNVTVEEESEFSDASTGLVSPACQIALSASGAEVPAGASLDEFSAEVIRIFTEQGFTADDSAATRENPNGTAFLLRRGDELASVEIDARPLDFETCPADQPLSECGLPPEQIGYAVRIYYSRLVVENP